MTDTSRPQDVGRSRRRKGAPSAATSSLLEAYQSAMRDELRDVLAELRGIEAEPGLLDVPAAIKRPSLADRSRLWDLGIKLGRELASAIDAPPASDTPAISGPGGRRRRPDYGGT